MLFPLTVGSATILDGESLSGPVYIGHGLLVGFIVPTGWDAADITLQAAPDGVAFYNLHEDGSDTEVTIQAAASKHIMVDPPLRGLGWIKVRSGTAGSPVNQTGTIAVGVVTEKNSAF